MIDSDTIVLSRIHENNQQALAQVVEIKEFFKEAAGPTIQEFLQYQATNLYCRKVVQSVDNANAE